MTLSSHELLLHKGNLEIFDYFHIFFKVDLSTKMCHCIHFIGLTLS